MLWPQITAARYTTYSNGPPGAAWGRIVVQQLSPGPHLRAIRAWKDAASASESRAVTYLYLPPPPAAAVSHP